MFMGAWEAATDLGVFLRGEVPELAPEARDILRPLGGWALRCAPTGGGSRS
jgi:hypothetical protein